MNKSNRIGKLLGMHVINNRDSMDEIVSLKKKACLFLKIYVIEWIITKIRALSI